MSLTSPKTLILAVSALAMSAAFTLPSLAASTDAATPGATTADQRPLPLRGQVLFNLVDKNADGSIDQTELAAFQKAVFDAIDANKDGTLGQDEFQKLASMGGPGGPGMHRPGGPRHEMRGDRDGRGPGHGPGRPGFFRGGPGGDRQGQLQNDQGPDGRGPGPMQFGEDNLPPNGPEGEPRNFASLDKNGDGVISPDEFATGAPAVPGMPIQQ